MQHIEQRSNEIFLQNSNFEDYQKIAWKTKRLGFLAYCKSGKVLENLRPVFIQVIEVDNYPFY